LNSGAPFPQRNVIIFLTFCVIFATLVLQGLSMPALIRRLGLTGGNVHQDEEIRARREMILAALTALRKIKAQATPEQRGIYDDLESHYRRRLALTGHEDVPDREQLSQLLEQQRFVAQELRDVERSVVLKLRDENKIHDEVLRALEHELDLQDARFAEPEF
jgi:CPA1 family monovalent cation:H+ antiporter